MTDSVLAQQVSCDGAYKPFGEMTRADVEARAAELEAAAAVPAMSARTAPVASAWRGLAKQMERADATTVAALELDREDLAERAGRLWITPPGGSIL